MTDKKDEKEKKLLATISAAGEALPAEPASAPEIAGYRVTSLLGAGGMGAVWRAVQLSTHREVALKILTAGAFGSQKARVRFEREVELAARLEHPHVARVYDSGLHKGMYYYAMELVDGIHLDRYVQSQGLSKRGIVELVGTVAGAVQHAHQRGIIHRDLKPSNILVTKDGRPHVVDFGLAKTVAAGDGVATVSIAGEVAGTPAYMSPEQAGGKGAEVDTRSDVYGLGAILYELLTGQFPHEMSGTSYEAFRRIAEDEVRRPRELSKAIDRELEALLLKALAHDPEARYASAADLAQDIANYLHGEPLSAKRPTTIYFLRKRIAKYRVPVAIAAVVLVALVAMAVFSHAHVRWQRDRATAAEAEAARQRDIARAQAGRSRKAEVLARRRLGEAERARDQAGTEAAKAKAVTEFLQDMLRSVDPYQARGREVTVRQVLDRAATGIEERFAGQGEVEAAVRETIGATYVSLGRPDKGLHHVLRAYLLSKASRGEDDPATLTMAQGLANAYRGAGKLAEAEELDRRITAARRRVLGADHADTLYSMNCLGCSLIGLGRFAAAEKVLREAVAGWERALGKEHPHTLMSLMNLANAIRGQKRYAEAGKLDRRLLEAYERVRGRDHPATLHVINNLGFDLRLAGKYAEAEKLVREALKGKQRIMGEDNPSVVPMMSNLAEILDHVGKGAEARDLRLKIAAIERRTEAGRRQVAASHADPALAFDVTGEPERKVGKLLAEREQAPSGVAPAIKLAWFLITCPPADLPEAWQTSALQEARELLDESGEPGDRTLGSLWRGVRGVLQYRLAARSDSGWAAAVEQLEKATADARTATGTGRLLLAMADWRAGRKRQAVEQYARAVDWVERNAPGNVQLRCLRGEAAVLLGRPWPLVRARGALRGHQREVRSLAFSRDGKLLATGSFDLTTRLWDMPAGRARSVLLGHRVAPSSLYQGVNGVAFLPDGKTLATAGLDGVVRLWDAIEGKALRTLAGEAGWALSVAASPDGKAVASGNDKGTLRVWNAADGSLRAKLAAHDSGVDSVAFSPDGKLLASASWNGTVKLWDVETCKARGTLGPEELGCKAGLRVVAFAHDGKTLAVGGFGGWLALYNLATRKPVAVFRGHAGGVYAVAFHPGGGPMASAAMDGTVRLWDPATGGLLARLADHDGRVWSLAYSPDGKMLASGGADRMVRLWEMATDHDPCRSRVALAEARSAAGWHRAAESALREALELAPDSALAHAALCRCLAERGAPEAVALGTKAVALGPEEACCHTALGIAHYRAGTWRSAAAELERAVACDRGCAVSRFYLAMAHQRAGDGDKAREAYFQALDLVARQSAPPAGLCACQAAAAGLLGLPASCAAERATLNAHTGAVRFVTFSPNGRSFATASFDGTAKSWDAATGKPLGLCRGHEGFVERVTYTPDGKVLATTGADGTVRLWDAAEGKQLAVLARYPSKVWGVAASPDGRLLACATQGGKVGVWELAGRNQIATLTEHEGPVGALAFSPDGKLLASGSDDMTARLWDTADWTCRAVLAGHLGCVYSVVFSPDGRTLATGGFDRSVKLWDVASAKERATLLAHVQGVRDMAFSPDGSLLATPGGRIYLWSVRAGRLLAALPGHGGSVWAVAFSPDGRTLVSAGANGTVKLWDITAQGGPATQPAGAREAR